TMLAPPPIQLPASAAMPFHTSPATTSGQNHWNSWKDTIAPRNRPKVPAQNTNSSLGPSFSTPLRSMVMVSRTRATGSSTRLPIGLRSEEHTSELQSRENLVCRLLLEKKKHNKKLG